MGIRGNCSGHCRGGYSFGDLFSSPACARRRATGTPGQNCAAFCVEFLRAPNRGGMALSPDGRFLAFTATRDGQMRLWIQPLDSTSARELPGTERAHLPFWSADSRSIGFFAGGKLKRVDADGGRLQTLADAPTPQGGTWNHDEVILFSPGSGAIYKIAAAGGTPVVVRTQDPGRQETINAPHFLADGKRFVYWTGSPNAEVVGVYAGSLDDPNMKVRIGKLDSWAIPTRTKAGQDYLIWARNDTVIAQPWDPVSARLIGEAVTLGGPVGVLSNTPELAVSENGLLVYGSPVELQLTWVDRSGKVLGTVGEPGFLNSPRLSPDARKVTFNRDTPDAGLFVLDLSRGISSRLASQGTGAAWSSDGSKIALTDAANRSSMYFCERVTVSERLKSWRLRQAINTLSGGTMTTPSCITTPTPRTAKANSVYEVLCRHASPTSCAACRIANLKRHFRWTGDGWPTFRMRAVGRKFTLNGSKPNLPVVSNGGKRPVMAAGFLTGGQITRNSSMWQVTAS
jgi:hypothetical protein